MAATYFVDAKGKLVLVEPHGRAHVFDGGSWHRDDKRAIKPLTAVQAERAFPAAFGEELPASNKREKER